MGVVAIIQVRMSLTPIRQATPPTTKKMSKGALRAWVLLLVHLAFAIHIWHYHSTGSSLSPVEPSEAMMTLEQGMLNAGFIFFVLAILSTLIFGRFFCGWGCHIVALQDGCTYLLKRAGIHVKPFRSRTLAWIPFLTFFYMFVFPQFLRIYQGRPAPAWVYHLETKSFWATFPNLPIAILTFVVCGGLAVVLLGNKGFCTYGCPYGAAFSFADRFSKKRIRVTEDCAQCGECTKVCSSNVRVHEEVKQFKMVVDSGCMKCLDCVSVCPNGALYYGSGATSALRLKPDRKYDFALGADLAILAAFVVGFYAFRNLFDLIPLLLAIGLSSITAMLLVVWAQVLTGKHARLFRWQLKSAGKVTGAGALYTVFGIGTILFLGYASLVQFYVHSAHSDLAVAQKIFDSKDKAQEPTALAAAHRSYVNLKEAKRISPLVVPEWEWQMGNLQVFIGNEELAQRHYKDSLTADSGQINVLRDLYNSYFRTSKLPEAGQIADQWVKLAPKSEPAIRARIQSLVALGQTDLAENSLRDLLEIVPNDPMANGVLGSLLAQGGDFETGIKMLEVATSAEPKNPIHWYNRGVAEAGKGRNKDAIRSLMTATELAPSPSGPVQKLAEIAIDAEDSELRLRALEQCVDILYEDAELVKIWATAVVKSGQKRDVLLRLKSSPADQKKRSMLNSISGDSR